MGDGMDYPSAVDSVSGHNHMTRDIKPPGQCPACDRYHGVDMRHCGHEWCGCGCYGKPHCKMGCS